MTGSKTPSLHHQLLTSALQKGSLMPPSSQPWGFRSSPRQWLHFELEWERTTHSLTAVCPIWQDLQRKASPHQSLTTNILMQWRMKIVAVALQLGHQAFSLSSSNSCLTVFNWSGLMIFCLAYTSWSQRLVCPLWMCQDHTRCTAHALLKQPLKRLSTHREGWSKQM